MKKLQPLKTLSWILTSVDGMSIDSKNEQLQKAYFVSFCYWLWQCYFSKWVTIIKSILTNSVNVSLTHVNSKTNITTIGEQAFYNCNSLREVQQVNAPLWMFVIDYDNCTSRSECSFPNLFE